MGVALIFLSVARAQGEEDALRISSINQEARRGATDWRMHSAQSERIPYPWRSILRAWRCTVPAASRI